jgi:hypothetical protein
LLVWLHNRDTFGVAACLALCRVTETGKQMPVNRQLIACVIKHSNSKSLNSQLILNSYHHTCHKLLFNFQALMPLINFQ